VFAHLRDDRPALAVLGGQSRQMPLEMLYDLSFRFSEKSEAPAIARKPGNGANRERAGVPNRVEIAGPASELVHSLCGPCQVVVFLLRRAFQLGAYPLVARRKCLPLVKRLGAYLAGMVHAHEASRNITRGRI